jgi:3'-phosphoadenosine 5'-phosphosulfate sulfotransferase (PAPS reductase)/FAD synthetase
MNKKLRKICLLSGGKDSTALALYLKDKYPNEKFEYLFADTHKELPEIYDYLSKVEAYLGTEIIRLASGMQERGFDHFLKVYGNYLPSPGMRWCTRQLKIVPFEQYIGDEPVELYIAIRADEHRDGHITTKPNVHPVYPFKEDGMTREDVFRILQDSAVGLPDYYSWRTRSGCFFCFFQRKIEWVGLLEKHPSLFQQAMDYEKVEEGYTWIEGEPLSELAKPERIARIKEEHKRRTERLKRRRKPKTLAQMFAPEHCELDDDEAPCAICHL